MKNKKLSHNGLQGSVTSVMRMVAGTARSMGINVVGEFPNM